MNSTVERAMTAFDYDPFIGCPFDRSELRLARSVGNRSIGDTVEFDFGKTKRSGTIAAIGENAKFLDGTSFTVVLVRCEEHYFVKTANEVGITTFH